MKRILCIVTALLLILAVPAACFAEGEAAQPYSTYVYSSRISKLTPTIAHISTTSTYDSTIEVVATAQLQKYVNDKWVNFGAAITNTKLSTTVTASKSIQVDTGYKYRVKGSHRIGVRTFTSYSTVLSF